jgi:hypothetical protein
MNIKNAGSLKQEARGLFIEIEIPSIQRGFSITYII